ncbi:hypothetical protein PM3016_5814 [Paenibacillus mucilaginosus 3016]|uniref:DUF1700 domain-containing protein n=1 Tax=Paenibacillus mucilaginosus 3016 TaxID=1116391 RepID=H6NNB1_9BACL|nr:DUF1700 domain-containing protein [Paenibacillus mucilaginosus]AFC32490.1 hypothetical protein PM3016_5814 [Paenibacillus mucilaginosus 3016]WFA20971.1 DUF1700 domain-containing protein [Paenibacillus mucilaginosus]
MSPERKQFLSLISLHLSGLPEGERSEAVRKADRQIDHAVRSGLTEQAALIRLGDPKVIAEEYRGQARESKRGARSFKGVLRLIGFCCTTGLLTAIVVPFLAALAYGFGISSILIFAAGLLRTFGVPWIPLNLGPGLAIPAEYSMAATLIGGVVTGWIGYVSGGVLKKYLAFLSASYRRVQPGQSC